MEHICCSVSYLILYLTLVSTSEVTDMKVSEKKLEERKQEEETVQVEIPKC
jgi:hypothetical protein